MESCLAYGDEFNLRATELRLGLPGTAEEHEELAVSSVKSKKRPFPSKTNEFGSKRRFANENDNDYDVHGEETCPSAKSQIVGWPPVRSYRKNNIQPKKNEVEGPGVYVKVSMDGAAYLRKIDLKMYNGYPELLKALENMFRFRIGDYSEREGYKGSDYVPTYEDIDGDWMLAGDVPWDMFMCSCKRLRIIRGSEARGLGCGV